MFSISLKGSFKKRVSSVAGYFSRGNDNTFPHPGVDVYKWAFPSDTVSTTTPAPSFLFRHGGFSDPAVAGYFNQGGDFFVSSAPPSGSVFKWAFPSDTMATTSPFPADASRNAGFSDPAVAGYFNQGAVVDNTTNVYKWAFPTDAVSQTTSSSGGMFHNSGFSDPTVAGYFSQGTFTNSSDVYKWAFPSDTFSTTTPAPDRLFRHGGFSDPAVAGYFAGFGNTTVYKWAFPSDAVSTTTPAPDVVNINAGFADPSVAGYFSQGVISISGQIFSSAVFKWTFPSDTTSTTTSAPEEMLNHAGFADA